MHTNKCKGECLANTQTPKKQTDMGHMIIKEAKRAPFQYFFPTLCFLFQPIGCLYTRKTSCKTYANPICLLMFLFDFVIFMFFVGFVFWVVVFQISISRIRQIYVF